MPGHAWGKHARRPATCVRRPRAASTPLGTVGRRARGGGRPPAHAIFPRPPGGRGPRLAKLRGSERHLVAALQLQDFAGLVATCDVEAQAFDDLAHLADLLSVTARELARADP